MLTGPGATIGKARRLRASMSLPEILLWRELRRRPGGYKFRRQHPAGQYVLDFACVGQRLAVEIDGECHSMGQRPHRDCLRDEWLATQGYSTLRIGAREVFRNLEGAIQLIIQHCDAAQPLRRRSAPPPPRAGAEL